LGCTGTIWKIVLYFWAVPARFGKSCYTVSGSDPGIQIWAAPAQFGKSCYIISGSNIFWEVFKNVSSDRTKIKDKIVKTAIELLEDESLRRSLWKAVKRTPPTDDYSTPYASLKISDKLFEIASYETAKYVMENLMSSAQAFNYKKDMLRFFASEANPDGLFLEFGVGGGDSQ